ncbi:caspase family protein [Streptacidiphilus griseoplanus]|uniref:caspase family protein n=1 Tax=Peterkaempfera griseoplana TaxID=66896 RepID=UPI0006E29898|nr:caspase family protein [Peterkaempfera griseoplana]
MTDSWAVAVPDRRRSVAVLIGTATHVAPSRLHPIPQVTADVTALAEVLTGPLGILDPSGVRSRVDPHTAGEVLDLVPGGRPAGGLDLLLFYFAGHGVLAEDDRLCLALPGTVDEPGRTARTSLPVDAVLEAMRGVRARYKVAVLDCCFSGRAMEAPAAASIHLLTATGPTRKARYGDGSRFTGFTGALLELLSQGVPEGGEYLDLSTVHRRLAVSLPAAPEPCPVPAQRAVGSTGDLALAVNAAHGQRRTRRGLAARARFALELRTLGLSGRPGQEDRLRQAVRVMREVAEDGAEALGRTDPLVLSYRHAHASLLGESGSAERALACLDAVVADWEAAAPSGAPGLTAARASRDHWRGRVPSAGHGAG